MSLFSALWDNDFPSLGGACLYIACVFPIVKMIQRVARYLSLSIDPDSRRVSRLLASITVGLLIWVLMLVNFLILQKHWGVRSEMQYGLASLLIVFVTTYIFVPPMCLARRFWTICWASVGMAAGLIATYLVFSLGYMAGGLVIDVMALIYAAACMVFVAGMLGVRHLQAKQRQYTTRYLKPSWPETLVATVFIFFANVFLADAVVLPLVPPAVSTVVGLGTYVGLLALIVFVTFVTHLRQMSIDGRRQQQILQSLSMVRHIAWDDSGVMQARLAHIADHLGELMDRRNLHLHFQPIVNTEQQAVFHFEALLRIRHAVLGAVNPELFLLACDLYEKTVDVDRSIVLNALEALEAWKKLGHTDIRLSVNVAPKTILSAEFAPWLEQNLSALALSCSCLQLELTEHAIIAHGQAMVEALSRLDRMGVAVVMDDFGAGFSSLAVLGDLPIRGLKCDRLFMQELLFKKKKQLLLSHLRQIATELNLSLTMEGVEQHDELQFVRELGFTQFQGYLFSRAMPGSQIMEWMNQQRACRGLTPVATSGPMPS